jgi:Tfp pilus assembly protein PilN
MDTGSNQLLARRIVGSETYSQQPFGEITFDTEPIVPPPSGMDFNAIQSLCLEVQRSMDYFHRQHPYVTAIDKVLIIPDTTELYELAGWMSEALMREVSLPTLPERLSATHPAILETALAMNFWSAIGLAMRDVPNIPSQLPRFDFQSQYARHKPDALLRRRLALSLAASLTVVLVGVIGTLKVGKMASNAYHEVEHTQEELQYLQKERKLRTEEIEKLQTLAAQCKREGLPVPLIVDELANSVPTQLGWTEITLNMAGNVNLYGEARTNRDIIHYLENLKTSKILSTVSLDSLDGSTPSTAAGALVKFQVTAQVAGVQNPAALAAATKP